MDIRKVIRRRIRDRGFVGDLSAVVHANVGPRRTKKGRLSPEELEEQKGEALPRREMPAVIDPSPHPTLPIEPPAEE